MKFIFNTLIEVIVGIFICLFALTVLVWLLPLALIGGIFYIFYTIGCAFGWIKEIDDEELVNEIMDNLNKNESKETLEDSESKEVFCDVE